jgi:hypothetical protein
MHHGRVVRRVVAAQGRGARRGRLSMSGSHVRLNVCGKLCANMVHAWRIIHAEFKPGDALLTVWGVLVMQRAVVAGVRGGGSLGGRGLEARGLAVEGGAV